MKKVALYDRNHWHHMTGICNLKYNAYKVFLHMAKKPTGYEPSKNWQSEFK